MIAQHIAALFIFLSFFVMLYNESLDPRLLVAVTVCCYVFGYVLWELVGPTGYSSRLEISELDSNCHYDCIIHLLIGVKMFKSMIFIVVALVILSPGLRTLTAATSSDSIWAISACLFILNTLLADYGATPPEMLYNTKYVAEISYPSPLISKRL